MQPPVSGRTITSDWRRGWGGCLLRGFIAALFGMVVVVLIVGSGLLFRIIRLRAHCQVYRFTSARIPFGPHASWIEREFTLQILDPSAGRRTYVTLDKIHRFSWPRRLPRRQRLLQPPGLDPGRSRAHYGQLSYRGQGGGASRSHNNWRVHFASPEERAERTYSRKAREIILAAEITRRYSKTQSLNVFE